MLNHSSATSKGANLSALAIWENVITFKECFLIINQNISKLGGSEQCNEPNYEKSLSLYTLSPGGLQAMSSHLLNGSSFSASRLDLRGPHISCWLWLFFYTFTYTSILHKYLYFLWIIWFTLTIFSHDSQILISRSDFVPWINIQVQVLVFNTVPLCVLLLCLGHLVVSGWLLYLNLCLVSLSPPG